MSSYLLPTLLLIATFTPTHSFAQGTQENCSNACITPVPTCILPENAAGTSYTMVYRLPIATPAPIPGQTNPPASCVMNRVSGNPSWGFPSYLKSYIVQDGGGHQPRPYVMAAREIENQDYTITNTPSTYVCVKNITADNDGEFHSHLLTDFANNGNLSTPYLVHPNEVTAQLCTTQSGNNLLSASDFGNIFKL
jgi:hypothetical protein